MIAYCNRTTGHIHFGGTKPPQAVFIAEHANKALLAEAIRRSGAQDHTEYRDTGHLVSCLSVPWFAVAKFPDEQAECISRFAERVTRWLGQCPPIQ